MSLKIKKELTYGHILTSLLILISLITLVYSWGESRKMYERYQAFRIRNAASATLGKVHRWEKICYSFFEFSQPIYVETSEILANYREYEKARDYLWKSLNRIKWVEFLVWKKADERRAMAYPQYRQIKEIEKPLRRTLAINEIK